jgi:PAS domain S-box-containing protein
MRSSPEKTNHPLLQALLVFILLAGVVVLTAVLIDFSGIDLIVLMFVIVLLCCALIAKNVYDFSKDSSQPRKTKKVSSDNFILPSRELYTELYKNSPVPYLLIDSKGYIRSGNLAARRLLGISQGKIEGINIFAKLECDEPEHLDLLIKKYQNGLAVSDENVRIKRNNSNEVWALLSLFQFSSATEHLGLLTLVDITKQKQIENAKSEFVSLASHQLRTPIAGIKWSAELLQMDSPDCLNDRQRKYIERLLTSANRMALLVDDFLRVSRFELGTFHREDNQVQLAALLKDIILEQTPRIEQKHLNIKTFFDSSINVIRSDQNLLRMIVGNLLSNAIKYSKEDGVIHVGYGVKDGNLLFSVADNGMGIPLADQERVFSKLFRAANAVRSVPDGTGLGLYIVKQAVDVLEGSITFTSVENMSTTFEVTVPL